jgi:transposase InsO family protein
MFDERPGGASTIYLIAFLDDTSRFIVPYHVIADKGSEMCAAVLPDTLQVWAPPCVLGSDNGGEFTGAVFTSLLHQYGVRTWRTTPYTPQQNS